MSKPKMVVLGFLHHQPMYGYQIGHIAEEFGLPVWASIKLPSIYKALQELEKSGHIRGEQVTEGNTPPRTVFHINDKGRKFLFQLVQHSLSSPRTLSQDWWLAVSMSWRAVCRDDFERAIRERLGRIRAKGKEIQDSHCQRQVKLNELPFVHNHLMLMGMRHHNVELKSLKELLDDVQSGGHDEYFLPAENKGA